MVHGTVPIIHYCLMCAKRPAHKQPAGGPNFHFPHAAQRDSIENKQGKRALGGVRQRMFAFTSPLIIESGSLSVVLFPEETAGGVASNATSTGGVLTIGKTQARNPTDKPEVGQDLLRMSI